MLGRLGGYVRRHHIGLLALFIAMGGTSYAAVRLPAGSVGTLQLRNGAVTARKLARTTRASLRGARGPVGPQGTAGTPGAKGDTGAPGQRGLQGPAGATTVTVRSNDTPLATGLTTTLAGATCHAGETAVGGGAVFVAGAYDDNSDAGDAHTGLAVIGSGPAPSNAPAYLKDGAAQPTAWAATVTNTTGASHTVRIFTLCSSP